MTCLPLRMRAPSPIGRNKCGAGLATVRAGLATALAGLATALAGLATALAGLLPAAATAQTTLDDVVISASRLEQRSFDSPAAIQSIDSGTVQSAGPQVNLSESINRVPGVTVLNRENYAQDLQLSIRGFGARSAFGIRGVRLLVDGIPATMPDGQGQASTIFLPGTGRIEVLRGPGAQLYGNAAGGVLQAFTAPPPEPPEVKFGYRRGSFDTDVFNLGAGGQRGDVGIVAGWSRLLTDGYRDHSAAVRNHANARVQIGAGEHTRVTLVGNAFDQPYALDPRGLTRDQYEADPTQAGVGAVEQDTRKSVTQNQFGIVIDHDLGAKRTLTGRLYLGERQVFQKLATPFRFQGAPTSQGGAIDLDRDYGGVGLQYSHEVRLASGRLTAVIGLDYDRMDERRQGFVNEGGVIGELKRNELNTVYNTDVYGLIDWLVNPDWTLSAGLRSSRVRFESDDDFIIPGNADDSGSRTYRATNPVLGVTRHLGEAVNLYANFGRGFETPTFAELAYRSTDGTQTGLNLDLDASRSRHFEAGIKARLGPSHRVDAALFLIDTTDEIVVAASSGGRTTYQNAGRTRRTGIEIAYAGRLSETLNARLTLSTLNARFRDTITIGSGNSARVVEDGNRLPGAPGLMAFGELVWAPRLGDGPGALQTAIELVHVGKVYVDDVNSDAAESYTVANLRAGYTYRRGPVRIEPFLRLNNVTDSGYAGSVIVNDSNGRFFEPAPGFNWLAGLTVALEL
ncbi:MAG: TonB-dependent receptor [Burkholderiales bacterium]|nr:MAG: TonB-dependent receptor [Burkholderiales bacterium]